MPMIQKNGFGFAIIPALLLWATNLLQGLFTWWAISVGGSGMEMAVLFPMFFIQIPSIVLLVVSGIMLIVARRNKCVVAQTAIPMVIYLLQVLVFWLCAFYR
jgi:hypothetical protein